MSRGRKKIQLPNDLLQKYLSGESYTNGFDIDDVEFLAKELSSTYNWKTNVYLKEKKYPILNIGRKKDRNSFINLVKSKIPNCFNYKIGE